MLTRLFRPFRHEPLKMKLLSQRAEMPRLARHFADPAAELSFDRSDWVSAYLDPSNSFVSHDGNTTATRAITLQGKLIWLVRTDGYKRAYHARSIDPEDAINEANLARLRRQEMRNHKDEVKRIVRSLRWLAIRHDVRVDDAYASPLCEEGVDGFLRALGLGRFRNFPGWLIAWLYGLDRQVGYVLLEAHRRWSREQGLPVPDNQTVDSAALSKADEADDLDDDGLAPSIALHWNRQNCTRMKSSLVESMTRFG